MATPLKLKKTAPDTATPATGGRPWRILIVDDDAEVHSVTKLLLGKLRFRDRGVEFLDAHSAAEAETLLAREADIALIFLDVVMETDDAGLRLVRHIREDLGNKAVRVVLRTGQPGQAPEDRVIVDYDINDYKNKTELTAEKLFTTTIAALRGYSDISALERSRRGLERILRSSDSLFNLQSMKEFSNGALTQLSAFLDGGPDGMLCVNRGEEIWVLAASGAFESLQEHNLAAKVPRSEVLNAIRRTLESGTNTYAERFSVLYIPGKDDVRETAAFISSARPRLDVEDDLLQVFTSKISVGFQNVTLFEEMETRVKERTRQLQEANQELERLATLDFLTGICNRRYFMQLAENELARSRRYQQPLSCLLADIDHFKRINDTWGHAVGDEALKAFAAALRKTLRECDVVGRLGGEEFVALLPQTDAQSAVLAAERLRAAIEALRLPLDSGGELNFTVSIGIAGIGPSPDDIEAMFKRADQAMYAAKEGGRNRVASQ